MMADTENPVTDELKRHFWDRWPRRIVKNGSIRYQGKSYYSKALENYENKVVYIDDLGDFRLHLVDDKGNPINAATYPVRPVGWSTI